MTRTIKNKTKNKVARTINKFTQEEIDLLDTELYDMSHSIYEKNITPLIDKKIQSLDLAKVFINILKENVNMRKEEIKTISNIQSRFKEEYFKILNKYNKLIEKIKNTIFILILIIATLLISLILK